MAKKIAPKTKKKTVTLELTAKQADRLALALQELRDLRADQLERDLEDLRDVQGKIDELDLSELEDFDDLW